MDSSRKVCQSKHDAIPYDAKHWKIPYYKSSRGYHIMQTWHVWLFHTSPLCSSSFVLLSSLSGAPDWDDKWLALLPSSRQISFWPPREFLFSLIAQVFFFSFCWEWRSGSLVFAALFVSLIHALFVVVQGGKFWVLRSIAWLAQTPSILLFFLARPPYSQLIQGSMPYKLNLGILTWSDHKVETFFFFNGLDFGDRCPQNLLHGPWVFLTPSTLCSSQLWLRQY